MGQHPQAYDDLKKRLLSEYKKLVSTKKNFDEKNKLTPSQPQSTASQKQQQQNDVSQD